MLAGSHDEWTCEVASIGCRRGRLPVAALLQTEPATSFGTMFAGPARYAPRTALAVPRPSNVSSRADDAAIARSRSAVMRAPR